MGYGAPSADCGNKTRLPTSLPGPPPRPPARSSSDGREEGDVGPSRHAARPVVAAAMRAHAKNVSFRMVWAVVRRACRRQVAETATYALDSRIQELRSGEVTRMETKNLTRGYQASSGKERR